MSELWPVSFNQRQQNEEAFFQKRSWRVCFPNVSQFPIGETLSPVSVFVSKMQIIRNYAYATRQGILTKIRACEQLQKFREREQASTHLIFASNSRKGQILRALSNWMGPFDTPIVRKGF